MTEESLVHHVKEAVLKVYDLKKNKVIVFQILFLLLLTFFYFYNFQFFYNISKKIIWETIYFLGIKNPLSWGRYFFVFFGNLFLSFIAAYGYSSLIFKFEKSERNLKIFCLFLPFTLVVPLLKGFYFFFISKHKLPILYLILLMEIISVSLSINISLNFYKNLRNANLKNELEIKELYYKNLNLPYFLLVTFLLALSAYIETFYLYTHILKSPLN